jgi:SAM-dependent methyltransferase
VPSWTEFPDLVAQYAAADYLEPAEALFLERHADALASGAWLDLGFGGGRTTRHLFPRVREYRGLDFDSAMVSASCERFPDLSRRGLLEQGTAEDLSRYDDGYFDGVWFSFNGIDYTPPDRIEALLRGVARVLKPGGIIFYSAHHLEAYPRLFEWDPHWSLLRRSKRLLRFAAVRFLNFFQNKSTAAFLFDPLYFTGLRRIWRVIREGRGRFTYAQPSWHEGRLRAAGFRDIQVSMPSGQAWTLDGPLPPLWLYYEARR